MAKTIFEEMGGAYTRVGDYLIPDLQHLEEKKLIGIWGKRHLRYLKEYRRVTYLNLLTSGKLNRYLADIDEQAEAMFSRLVKEYAQRQGATEQLKEENALEWVRRTNNIGASVTEIINNEIIYK